VQALHNHGVEGPTLVRVVVHPRLAKQLIAIGERFGYNGLGGDSPAAECAGHRVAWSCGSGGGSAVEWLAIAGLLR